LVYEKNRNPPPNIFNGFSPIIIVLGNIYILKQNTV